jgi:hypothetical protein
MEKTCESTGHKKELDGVQSGAYPKGQFGRDATCFYPLTTCYSASETLRCLFSRVSLAVVWHIILFRYQLCTRQARAKVADGQTRKHVLCGQSFRALALRVLQSNKGHNHMVR